MTDNAKNYTLQRDFQGALADLGARHVLIRPHCPWQNGKVERLNRTLQVEWAYRRVYRSNAHRTRALATWLRRYNTERPHVLSEVDRRSVGCHQRLGRVHGRVEPGHLVGRQRDVGRRGRGHGGLGPAAPGDRDHPRALGQHPGQGHLLGGGTDLGRHLGEGGVVAGEVSSARPMPPSGLHGMNAMPSGLAVLELALRGAKAGENSFCTLTSRPPSTRWASSIWATVALDTPAMRIFPSSRSSAKAPTDSAHGTRGSGRWYW